MTSFIPNPKTEDRRPNLQPPERSSGPSTQANLGYRPSDFMGGHSQLNQLRLQGQPLLRGSLHHLAHRGLVSLEGFDHLELHPGAVGAVAWAVHFEIAVALQMVRQEPESYLECDELGTEIGRAHV